MAKQMEMFDDGGLMDEGGTVDPVSGNDVPPGSNQEEVRDDIPAQLSEGEFVFPADVVRFIGLEKLMMIRQRAKAGLQRMEDMGQMGNSEEAVMPDDLPFSIEDLDMEDDELEMAQGGVVRMANGGTYNVPDPSAGVYYNPAGSSTTGVAAAPMKAASSNIARSIPIAQAATPLQAGSGKPTMFTDYELPQAPVPIMPQRDDLPAFLGEVTPGISGVDYVNEVYVNEAGDTKTFRRYKDDRLLDENGAVAVIPEGYTIKSEAEKDVGTGPVKVETATVQDDGGDDNSNQPSGASISLGGTKVGPAIGGGIPGTRFAGPSRKITGSTIFDVSFEKTGTLNPLSFVASMISKDGKLASEGIARIGLKGRTDPANTVRINAGDYNIIRNDLTGNLAKAYQSAGNLTQGLDDGSIVYNNDKKQLEDLDGNKIDMPEYKYTDEFGNSVTTTGLDKLGEGIYQDIEDKRNQTNWSTGKNYTDAEIGRGMSNATKAANRAYVDSQFANFDLDDTPASAPAPAPTPDMGIGQDGPDRGGDNNNDNNNDDGGRDYGGGIDDAAFDAFGDFAKGGLAKQMKRSGLASKK